MSELIFHKPFLDAMKDIGHKCRKVAYDFAKYPTEKNEAFAVGYLSALHDNSLIRQDTYTYMLSVFGQLREQSYIVEAIKELKRNEQ